MKKGIFMYFGHGWDVANETLKNISFKEKMFLFAYLILSFIGRIFIFTRPIFEISDNNLSVMMKECHSFSLDKIFEGATDPRTYGQLLFSYIVKLLMILGNLVLYMLPLALYWGVTILFGYAYGSEAIILLDIAIIISAVVSIFYIVFIIVMFIYQEPMGYIAQKNKELDASDIMYNATSSLKSQGKWAIFCTYLIPFLISTLLLAVLGLAIYLLFYYCGVIGGFIAIVLSFVFLFILANFLPLLLTAGTIAKHSIIEDVALTEKIVVVKPVPGEIDKFTPLFVDNETSVKKVEIER